MLLIFPSVRTQATQEAFKFPQIDDKPKAILRRDLPNRPLVEITRFGVEYEARNVSSIVTVDRFESVSLETGLPIRGTGQE